MMTSSANGEEIDPKLHSEIVNLIHYVDRLRKEVAGIAQQRDDQTHFEGMADRLDAIVSSTAEATDIILAAMEKIEAVVDQMRALPIGDQVGGLCDNISQNAMAAMEACSFQDLTGQRVSKVIGSLRFVEERVNAMAELCGRQAIEGVEDAAKFEEQVDDGVTLEGPQNPDGAISQDDIDQLFA